MEDKEVLCVIQIYFIFKLKSTHCLLSFIQFNLQPF